MAKVLVVEAEPKLLHLVNGGLRPTDLEVVAAATAGQALERIAEERPDAVILNAHLPDLGGLDALARIRQAEPFLPVVLTTPDVNPELIIRAMGKGACAVWQEPVGLPKLDWLMDHLRKPPSGQESASADRPDDVAEPAADGLVGRSPAMQEVYQELGRLAPLDVIVLLVGESGTGKDRAARLLHRHGPRAAGRFVALNCAAIPEPLLESELFGHEQGAFTGADRQRIGRFEEAHGGTLFLDEIGDTSPAIQAKLLRVVQDQTFERVGGNASLRADVRLVAATHRDLEAEVAAGRFRLDLLHRLNGFTVRLPALRQRPGDVPDLVDHFRRRFNEKFDRRVQFVAEEAMALLRGHAWPGNVRELESAVRHAVVHAAGQVVTADCLPEGLRREAPARLGLPAPAAPEGLDLDGLIEHLFDAGDPRVFDRVIREVERVLLERALGRERGNQVQASRRLGISRTTLRAKLQTLGADPRGESLEDRLAVHAAAPALPGAYTSRDWMSSPVSGLPNDPPMM